MNYIKNLSPKTRNDGREDGALTGLTTVRGDVGGYSMENRAYYVERRGL